MPSSVLCSTSNGAPERTGWAITLYSEQKLRRSARLLKKLHRVDSNARVEGQAEGGGCGLDVSGRIVKVY
jgi:hypothetical protein